MDDFTILQQEIPHDLFNKKVIEQLYLADKSKNETINNYNNIINPLQANDLRLFVFEQLYDRYDNSAIQLILIKNHLSNIEWWKNTEEFKQENISITEEQKENVVTSFIDDLKIYLIFSVFKILETFLRDLHRNILPNSKKKDKDIYSVRNEIIEYTNVDKDYKKIIQIFQHIRNSFHNNGFHFRNNVSIEYKGICYSFIDGQPISFIDFEFMFFLFSKTNTFILEIVNSPVVSKIQYIESINSKVKFQ